MGSVSYSLRLRWPRVRSDLVKKTIHPEWGSNPRRPTLEACAQTTTLPGLRVITGVVTDESNYNCVVDNLNYLRKMEKWNNTIKNVQHKLRLLESLMLTVPVNTHRYIDYITCASSLFSGSDEVYILGGSQFFWYYWLIEMPRVGCKFSRNIGS